MEKQWLVAYTRPQWERIVHKQLESWYGLQGWCPFRKEKRQYTDRIKMREVPFFKSYVFVEIGNYHDQVNVLKLDGVIDYIRYLGKPAMVSNQEMIELKRFINTYRDIEVTNSKLQGKKVVVKTGMFGGYEGIIKAVKNDKIILELPQLGFVLEASAESVIAISA